MMYILAGIAVCCLMVIAWLLKNNLKKRPRPTIIIIMALLIFMITTATIAKTSRDYKEYIAERHGVMITNITFAVFLDFSVLIIGGLFLYLANEIYLTDKIEEEKLDEAKKLAEEKLREAEEYVKPFEHRENQISER
ncbi:MAG: hypothetical protein HZA78_12660 [Candidatus Schekmanbacteria bacterium]|nr:hypothetical protein [Candidatus Schekmanbacteria bacterium]